MKKIGKKQPFFVVLAYLILSSASVFGQQIEVTAELSETNIYSGERVTLNVKVSGPSIDSVEEPRLPPIEGLRWMQGSSSRSSQYSIINGRPSVSYTFGFQLVAQATGNYTLPSLSVEVNGQSYRTGSISFNVLDPETIQNTQRSPNIYLRLETDVEKPVVGQQIIADVILYFKDGIEVSSYQSTPGWKAEGFWKEELQNPQRAQTTSTIINGVRYQRARLLQYALFPTKAGELTLSPFEVTVAVRERRAGRDPFGFGLGQERMELSSREVSVNVSSLSETSDAIYVGAVGSFSINREISPTNALIGESIEVKTTITGAGNVPLINKPRFNYPASLEEYAPQESSEIQRQNRIISGTKTFIDILIARNEGNFTIPEENVAYFNPETNRHHIITLPALSLNIERDPNAVAVANEQLRLNITPITGLASWTTTSYTPLHKRFMVWALLLFPILITGLAYGYKLYDHRMNTDDAFARSKKAHKNASELLSKAENATQLKDGYYFIGRALFQFISDTYNLAPAGLNANLLIETIEKDSSQSTKEEVRKLLSKCETIAYAPNATQEGLQNDIQKTRALIKAIGKQK